MKLSRDTLGKILESQVNSTPIRGGVLRKASYCAHEGTIYVGKKQANREQILRNNAKLREERTAIDGGVMLTIPEEEYLELIKHHEAGSNDFWKAVMKKYPEYISSG